MPARVGRSPARVPKARHVTSVAKDTGHAVLDVSTLSVLQEPLTNNICSHPPAL